MAEDQKIVHDAEIVDNAQEENVKKDIELRYSGFWVRWAARMIDGVVIWCIMAVIAVPVFFLVSFASMFIGMNIFIQILMAFLGLAITWTYYIIMTEKYQATVGKMAVGAKVVARDGQKLKMNNIILRETIGKFVSGLICNIGYLMAAFTRKKQGLHDFIGKSVVIYKDPQEGPNKTIVAVVYVLFGLFMFFVIFVFMMFFLLFGMVIFLGVDAENGESINDITPTEYEMEYNEIDDYLQEFSDGIEKQVIKQL